MRELAFTPPSIIDAHRARVEPLFQSWTEKKSVPQTLLFAGPQGIGKQAFTRFLAQALQCEESPFKIPDDGGFGGLFGGGMDPEPAPSASTRLEPCGKCTRCRRFEAHQPFDWFEIESDSPGETLKVEPFRRIKEKLGQRAYESPFLIFSIPNAERMTMQAANSILKVIEEPPEGWIFIFTTSDVSRIPATVLSRCQLIRLGALPESVLKQGLREEGVNAPDTTPWHLSEGSYDRLKTILSPEWRSLRSACTEILQDPESALPAIFDKGTSEPDFLEHFLEVSETLLSDLFKLARTTEGEKPELTHADLSDRLSKILDKRRGSKKGPLTGNEIFAKIETAQRLRGSLTTAANTKLVLQAAIQNLR